MMNFMRRKKDPYSWSYHNDMMAATGKLPLHAEFIRYHVSLGVGVEFDKFIQRVYIEWQKHRYDGRRLFFPPIHFLSAAEAEAQFPMIGLIHPSQDFSGREFPFGIVRLLEHPLAREFSSVIPWLFRQTFSTMRNIVKEATPQKNMPELYKSIEDLRWVDHKLSRRSVLEEVILQLNTMRLCDLLSDNPKARILEISQKIRGLKSRNYQGIRLPLPENEEFVIPSVIFWLQLLETALGSKFPQWQVYWCYASESNEAILLFTVEKLDPKFFVSLFDKNIIFPEIANGLAVSSSHHLGDFDVENTLSLMRLLSRWGEYLKL